MFVYCSIYLYRYVNNIGTEVYYFEKIIKINDDVIITNLIIPLSSPTGINGPLEGYVRTKPRKTPPPNGWGVYALDTEMVYTVHGLEVARVTVVNVDGRLIYNTLVKPDCEVRFW